MVLGLRLGDEVIGRSTPTVNSHSREILPAIEALVADGGISLSQLDALVFGRGPGSFTGLRIAVGVVQGLGYGLDIPAVPVSSMASLAQRLAGKGDDSRVVTALHARLEEVYFGSYGFRHGFATPLGPELVADVKALPRQTSAVWYGIGDAWQLRGKMEQALGVTLTAVSEEISPTPGDLLALGAHLYENGAGIPAIEASPVYLREEVAKKIGAQV